MNGMSGASERAILSAERPSNPGNEKSERMSCGAKSVSASETGSRSPRS